MKAVKIEMDKTRNLKFGINALIELEKELGVPLTELSEKGFGLSEFRTILYVGLKAEDKKLTVEKVGDLMDDVLADKGMEYLTEKMAEAMNSIAGGGALPSDK